MLRLFARNRAMWTPEEIATVRRHAERNVPVADIAEIVGRTPSAVRKRLQTLLPQPPGRPRLYATCHTRPDFSRGGDRPTRNCQCPPCREKRQRRNEMRRVPPL